MRRDFQPVGDMLVSYQAAEMPTETLHSLAESHFAAIREAKESELRSIAQILGWLLRIAVHKIRALEAQR